MRSTENIKSSIQQLDDKTSEKLNKRTLDDIYSAMDKQQTTQLKPGMWRTIMNSKLTKIAVAAAIILVAITIINQFGGSINGTSVALADVRQALDHVKYMRRGNSWSGSGISCFNRPNGYCVYVTSNPDRKQEYDPETKIITLSWPGDGYCGAHETPLETAKRQFDLFIKCAIKHEMISGELDGQEVDIIKIYGMKGDPSRGTKENPNEVITMWCDSKSHLLLKLNRGDVTILYSYPDKAPADIYELGAPRNAMVVSTVPNEETQEVITKFYRARKAALKHETRENMFGYLTPERAGQIIENEYAQQHGLICLEQFRQGKMWSDSTFSLPSKLLYFFDPEKDYLWVRREQYVVPKASWQINKNWFPKDQRKLKPQHTIYDILEFDRGADGVWFPVKVKESRGE
jgi:hypothetical protein